MIFVELYLIGPTSALQIGAMADGGSWSAPGHPPSSTATGSRIKNFFMSVSRVVVRVFGGAGRRGHRLRDRLVSYMLDHDCLRNALLSFGARANPLAAEHERHSERSPTQIFAHRRKEAGEERPDHRNACEYLTPKCKAEQNDDGGDADAALPYHCPRPGEREFNACHHMLKKPC